MNKNLQEFDLMVAEEKATWWEMELPSKKVIFGDTKPKMIGYPPEKFKTYEDFTKLIHPDDYENTMGAMMKHLKGEEDHYRTVYRIKKSDGNYATFYDYGKIIEQDGDYIKLIGFVLKIENPKDYKDEVEYFENLIEGKDKSLVDLFGRARS